MKHTRLIVLVILTGLAFALALSDLMAQSKPASPADAAPAAVRTAVCDLVKTYTNYQRAKDLRIKVEESRRNFKSEDELRAKKIDSLTAELKELNPSSKEYETRLNELAKLTIERETLQKFEDARNMREFYRMSEEIYDEVRKAAGDVAREKRFHLVVTSDDTPPRDDKADLFDRMERKKVLYNDPSLDITDAIVAKLNEQYKTEKK